MGSVLFFLGILTSIAALETTGVLGTRAQWMNVTFHNNSLLAFMIGIVSAVIDNVPLVAGAMGLYHMSEFAQNHSFWIFLSYCAGTGGSCLIIGSAAGVAAMGLGKIDFIWYLKRITPLATLGYVGGAVVYLLQSNILH
jgi:Na+/H+ antiporter NhaD/arsenite permease-like protein